MADAARALSPTVSDTLEIVEDDELLFDDDLLDDDEDDGEPLEILEEAELDAMQEQVQAVLDDDAPSNAVFDKDALVRRDVWNGLVHCIVSNAKLWSTVDVAEVKDLMSGSIAILPQGPLILEPLWRYMAAKGTPKKAAAETLLFFHSRAERWNVTMILPAAMEELNDDTRAAVADKLKARGVTTGTHVGRAPTAPGAKATKAANAAKSAKTAKRKRLGAPKAGDASGTRRMLARLAAIGVVAAGAFVAMEFPEREDVSARASAALGSVCEHAHQEGGAVLCTTDSITLSTNAQLHERQAIAETALDVTIVFVDREGLPLPLPAAH